MKKTVKSLLDFLCIGKDFQEEMSAKKQEEYGAKAPKMAVLSCPYPVRYVPMAGTMAYWITSYGGAVAGNELTLDYAIKNMELPLCVVLGHEDCSALRGGKKGNAATKEEAALFQAIAPAFTEGKGRRAHELALKHIDYQISILLERYRSLVKEDKLLIVGVFCDKTGALTISNYNGLRGKENLSQVMPDTDACFFHP